MDRINIPQAYRVNADGADPDATVINGAPYDFGQAIPGLRAADKSGYREEYIRDRGPDLDESRDGTESGQ
jgi:hypothetical protein